MSTLRADTIADKAGTGPATLTGQFASKSYANIDAAATINDSFNISSADDDGTGDFGFNFTNNFAAATMAVTACAGHTTRRHVMYDVLAVGNVDVVVHSDSNVADPTTVSIGVFGDLA